MDRAALKPSFRRFLSLLAAGCMATLGGCSSAEEAQPPHWSSSSSRNDRGADDDWYVPCKDGATKSCSITTEQANGVKSCWKGTQTCQDGVWQRCLTSDVDEATIVRPARPGIRSLALSTPQKCVHNPCDPECMLYNEVPLSPITMPAVGPDWQEGDPQNFADGPQIKTSCTSQQDCQIDSYCDDASDACGHGLCEMGEALDSSCNPCVAEICEDEDYEHCCSSSGSWNAACIAALAGTSCGSAVPNPPFGTNVCDYAVFADGTVSVQYGTVSGGPIGGNSGSIAADYSTTDGIFNHGAVSVYMASVDGDLIGSPLGFESYATVSGTKSTSTSVYMGPVLPTTAFTCPTGGAAVTVPSGSTQTLSPGPYGAVTVSGSAGTVDTTLVLSAGTYTLTSLSLSNATLRLPAAGKVELLVCGKVTTSGRVRMEGITDALDGLRFRVYSARVDSGGSIGAASIVLASEQTFYGLWEAPRGTVWGEALATKGAKLYGLVRAAQASFSYGLVDASGLTGDACLAAGLDPSSPPVCPAPPRACKRNPLGSVDSTCSGVDLSVAPPCADTVPVCNHGAMAAPSGAVLHFFERADHVGPSLSPDLTKAVGTCTTTVPIPSGQCRSIPCDPSILDEELAIVVNATGAISECSLEDNWSSHVNDVACHDVCLSGACPTPPATYAVSERYEASCPHSTSPIWSSMRWRTSTPGAASITFEVRSAETSAGLDAAAYVPAGTAQLPDNEECQFTTDLPGCPADLSAALGELGSRRKSLELRTTLRRDGTNTPILYDWGISYTCQFDE